MGTLPWLAVTREYAGPSSYLGPLPTAVVLLERDSAPRNSVFCNSFKAVPQSGSPGGFVRSAVATRWPLTVGVMSEAQSIDCGYLIEKYDYTRADELRLALRQAGADPRSLEGAGPFIAQFLPTGGVVVVNLSPFDEGTLVDAAQQWIMLAGQQSVATGAQPEQRHVTCNLLQGGGEACTVERVFLESVVGVLRERFPEAAVGVALGQRVLCALLRGGAQASWCGPGPA